MNFVYTVLIAQSVVIVLLGILVVGLLRSHAETLRMLDRLGASPDPTAARPATGTEHDHSIAPQPVNANEPNRNAGDVVGVDPNGQSVVISTSNRSGLLLLAFLSTSCSSCEAFWSSFRGGRIEIGDRSLRAVAVTLGPEEESPTRAGRLQGSSDVVMSSETWKAYGVPGAPYFVLVDTHTGTVRGEGSAMAPEQLRSFVADAESDREWDRRRRPKAAADQEREARIDHELSTAGLHPGDPQLYPKLGELTDEEFKN